VARNTREAFCLVALLELVSKSAETKCRLDLALAIPMASLGKLQAEHVMYLDVLVRARCHLSITPYRLYLPEPVHNATAKNACAVVRWRPPMGHPIRHADVNRGDRYRRVVAHDNTVRAGATTLQLPPRSGQRSHARRRVELQLRLDGQSVVWDGQRALVTTRAPDDAAQLRALAAARVEVGTPAASLGSISRPRPSHPWRRINPGSKLYHQ
jgi:hypothetical protein